MYRLKLFGSVALMAEDAPIEGRAVQRRRLALLSILALSREKSASRERIAALLWPEADTDRARHLVSDSIYRINQALQATAVSAIGDDLHLERSIVSVDVLDFCDAFRRADWRRCVELYAGELLDAFVVPDAPDFERWADGERAQRANDYQKALESLALDGEARGEHALAIDYWRRAAVRDPHSSRVALLLMRALDRSGERAAAIKHARIHTELVRQEVGAEPDVQVIAFADELARLAPVPSSREIARAHARRASGAEGALPSAALERSGGTVFDLDAGGTPTVQKEPLEFLASTRVASVSRNVRWRSLGVISALAVATAVNWLVLRRPAELPAAPAGAQRSIAVLPFANQSGDDTNDYMSDGITDELISTLGEVRGLRVTSRTSVFALKGTHLDVRDVARRLGVESVLEGSVRRAGDHLRVTAQLVTARDGYQLWSETFDRRVSDVLDIQQQIAAAIVDRLRGVDLAASTTASPHPADDPVAYDLYLQGRYAWHQRTEGGLRQAVERFSAAVARSPRYARAYAGLGDAYAVLAFYDYVAPREAFPRAREAAERAVALDSTLAAPHATLGYVDLYYDWRFDRAEGEFRRSLALDPTYSMAHQWYGNLLTSRGRFDEAERELRLSQELDPLSLIANAALGWVYLYAGRYDEAVQQCRRTLALDDRFALAWLWQGMAETERGQLDSAVVMLRHAASLSGEAGIQRAALARVYALAGARDSARSIIAALERRGSDGYVPRYEIAKAQLALGDRDAALASLARALDDRAHSMVFLAIDPQFEPLRREPRFVALREAVEHSP